MTRDLVRTVALLAAVALCLVVIVVNQQTTGWMQLGLMLLGLAGLIAALALYNRRHR